MRTGLAPIRLAFYLVYRDSLAMYVNILCSIWLALNSFVIHIIFHCVTIVKKRGELYTHYMCFHLLGA